MLRFKMIGDAKKQMNGVFGARAVAFMNFFYVGRQPKVQALGAQSQHQRCRCYRNQNGSSVDHPARCSCRIM